MKRKILGIIQTDISDFKFDISTLKIDVSNLKVNMASLQEGQAQIKNKVDNFTVIQNDDIVTLARNTYQIRQDVKIIHTDVLYP